MNTTSLKPGSLLTYAIDSGYPESILYGYKLDLLTETDYSKLIECNVIDDIRVYLQTTSYGDVFDTLTPNLDVSAIKKACTAKLAQEFEYLRCNSVEPLSTFLEYIRMAYMIDNVILLIAGAIRDTNVESLREKCHPLGIFEGMQSLTIEQSLYDLYNLIVIETNLAPYFQKCLSVEDLDELNIEIVRNTIYRAYLEDFHAFCKKLGGTTAELMNELLSFEASRRSINITLNSFNTELRRDERAKLYPRLGPLDPEGLRRLELADNFDQVRDALQFYPVYKQLFDEVSSDPDKTLEDVFFKYEAQLNKLSFMCVANYACFYSYFKLKEQEIRNIVWISECVVQSQKQRIGDYISVS
ncbi:V-type proton ATPase subunit d-like [Schistocerca gregaria]|uniref:V-type proton ATPase subunit d-like n=1 Tax=Schistocerca gregaria TaxID=7010 RepID=UPI00211DB2CB|nr:V-type proton ATPase subunit d-like [Schistocerca gregaria]